MQYKHHPEREKLIRVRVGKVSSFCYNDPLSMERAEIILNYDAGKDGECAYSPIIMEEMTPELQEKALEDCLHRTLYHLYFGPSGERSIVLLFKAHSPYVGCWWEYQGIVAKVSFDKDFNQALRERVAYLKERKNNHDILFSLLLKRARIVSTKIAPGEVNDFFQSAFLSKKKENPLLVEFLGEANRHYRASRTLGFMRPENEKSIFGVFGEIEHLCDCFDSNREDWAMALSVITEEENLEVYYWKSYPSNEWVCEEQPVEYYFSRGMGGVAVCLEDPMSTEDYDSMLCPGCHGPDHGWYEHGRCSDLGSLCEECEEWSKELTDRRIKERIEDLKGKAKDIESKKRRLNRYLALESDEDKRIVDGICVVCKDERESG